MGVILKEFAEANEENLTNDLGDQSLMFDIILKE